MIAMAAGFLKWQDSSMHDVQAARLVSMSLGKISGRWLISDSTPV
jgi:hypothetical protein